MSRFALVTLVHNKEKFLKQCIKSALAQTTKKFLYVIINDGSTDNSEDIIMHYKKLSGNILYYTFKNKAGQMNRYNYALHKINKLYPGIHYMAHLDADDMLKPNAIERSQMFFERTKDRGIGHISSLFSIIDAKGNVLHKKGRSFPKDLTVRHEWRRAQLANNLFGHFRVMRIACLNKIGGFDERFEFATDYSMVCKMLDKFNVGVLPEILYLWRKHKQQIEGLYGGKQTQCWRDIKVYYKKKWGM